MGGAEASGAGDQRPKVSIGLPVHNGERYLPQALESLLGQDEPDLEVIVSDNASEDDSVQIARRYADEDPRVHVHAHPTNRGAAWNFNHAFHLSRGVYFKWAAHDDLYRPSFVRRCVDLLESDPLMVLAYSQAVDIDEDARVIRSRPAMPIAQADEARERLRSVLLTDTPCFEAFGLARRVELATTSLIGPYTGSDRTLLLELAGLGRFGIVDDALFLHRQHPDRSVYRYPRGRDRSAWFDSDLAGTVTFPSWRIMREYARVLRSVPLGRTERVRVFGDLATWVAAQRVPLARQALGGTRDQMLAWVRGSR